jgi:prepilin-type N-terminal cleavage/methylation domain-containing protein
MAKKDLIGNDGLTLIETIVAITIVGMLAGLTLIGIQAVRNSSRQTQSGNNVAQLLRASEQFSSDHGGRLPPISGFYGSGAVREEFGSYFLALMPYVEQGAGYDAYLSTLPPPNQSGVTINGSPISNGIRVSSNYRFAILESPSDPTVVSQQTGLCSYAINATALSRNDVSLSTGFTDGRSNTLLIGEHFAYDCRKRMFSWSSTDASPGSPEELEFRIAAFAHRPSGDVVPIKFGNETRPSRSGMTFQTLPQKEECDPSVSQALQRGGLQVGIADGSVRIISQQVGEVVFWSAVTANGGEARGEL